MSERGKSEQRLEGDLTGGYYFDPPGFSFYTNRLDKKGESMVDPFGIALLDCNRGTNDVEVIHKQVVACCGAWLVHWCGDVRDHQKINERK
jgi:hypothetical protein